jgi:uncharacterized peroxidase-related enzyme
LPERGDEGATDLEIHDTVLIAAMFCMCNRYVDGRRPIPPPTPLHITKWEFVLPIPVIRRTSAGRISCLDLPNTEKRENTMAHIKLPEGIPGIRGPMQFRPETAKPLNEIVDVLLRGPHSLSQGERELIGTYVSARNDCRYCQTIHGAIAAHHLHGNEDLVACVKQDPESAEISPKLKALLAIAAKVQQSGKDVTTRDIERARNEGATDLEIHDTVLIAAVFCMCNRYVDGLATWAPDDPEFYRQRAAIVATNGYAASTITAAVPAMAK